MKEEVIQLSEHFKGLTDSERVIVWQTLTIDILRGLMQRDTDALVLLFREGDHGDYVVQLRAQRRGEISDPLMTWHGGTA